MAAVTYATPQTTEAPIPQSLLDRIEVLETREKFTAERTLLCIEMGILQVDNQRTSNHKEFISKAKDLIEEVKELRTELQQTLQAQESKSKQLIDENYTAYESWFSVLQDTIKSLRRSLTAKESVDEILHLTKEIYQTLFNREIPINKVVCDQMATQFNIPFKNLDELK